MRNNKSNKETYLGEVQDVNGTNVSISLSKDSLTGFIYIDGQGYRVGQIGSFVRISIGFNDLFGIVSQVGASAAPLSRSDSDTNGNQWMSIQLIGEGPKNGVFQRGLSQYPTVGDEVHLVSEKELNNIYGQPNKPYFVNLGHISNAESIPALVDVNKLVTRHSAVVGTTGSGKSTTVASIINALSNLDKYPSSRIIMLDLHGEYGQALQDKSNIYKINPDKNSKFMEDNFLIPYWALSFDELCSISFGEFNNEKDRNIVMERIQKYKIESIKINPRDGVSLDSLSVDSPIPFSIHELWHELFIETFGTYYKDKGGKPKDNLAYELDNNGNELKGNPMLGIPPVFKNIVTAAGEEKINHIPGGLNIGKQLLLLGTKLRIPRYDFIFKPGNWLPDSKGNIKDDLDVLLKGWLGGNRPVSILDLSGVPTDILQTTIGALLRLLYEALFWARNLSQGGRSRPLLIVMEEAHIYLNDTLDGAASKIVQRIVKEGRKYGIGAMIVSQRPSEINPTILSQCGTFFALRLTNSSDRAHISSALSDSLDGLTNMLPILRTGEAIILGESVKLPMRTSITAPPENRRPDSQDPVIYDELSPEDSLNPGGWGIKLESHPRYDELVETWRAQNPKIGKIK
ncbi:MULTISPECIES: ATP-binding protein [Vibrio]|uniref:ATP-binding protein n=1 Tax=Vibrio TaxID=662 RepID=UPI000C846110|nr:ATP-binding protein [Vibrio cyclitrophicus]PME19617.1 ATPase [Vibrio cyclitrophicus]PME95110.1 ATPase [Vibrio cyclitrophicus]PMF30313.1 ATPase [Vibrio cyclitrophicus]PMG14559.1 ATPase [Vibrio cyclitrophicus]PMG87633.1 ATPase [Vibrio cyclitrophicus]